MKEFNLTIILVEKLCINQLILEVVRIQFTDKGDGAH